MPDARHRSKRRPPIVEGCPAEQIARVPRQAARGSRTRGRLDLARPRALDEVVFRDLIARERKRADRSERPCLLLLVEPHRADSASGQAVIDALAAITRKTDVVGRFGPGAIGVLLPEAATAETGRVRERFATRLRQELALGSHGDTADRLSIRVHVHPGPGGVEEAGRWSADPVGFPGRPSRRTFAGAVKRALDVAGSAALLLLLAPLFLLIAALVKLMSPGPVVYEQVRVGQDMKPFTMFKFRTMYRNADHALHREFVRSYITASRPASEHGAAPFFKLTGDPRITPIGYFLRKTSLDELPQLWNVLRGDMSLVGPRPALPYELEQYKPWHRRRVLEAKPGITGLWQVTGRSRTTFDEMVRLDLRYARSCSLWADIKILLATPAAVISGRGAC